MIPWLYETTPLGIEASRRHSGAFGSSSQEDPWRLDGDQDRCPPAASGRSAPRMDNRSIGTDSYEFESLDARNECSGNAIAGTQIPSGPATPPDGFRAQDTGSAFGTESARLWLAPRSMGWAHSRRAPEEAFWDWFEGTPSADVDAPTGLPHEAGWPCLPSSSQRGCPSFPGGVKKNSKPLGLMKPLSSRMRPALLSTPAWGAVGPSGESGCGFRPRVSTNNGSISPAGWLRSWDDMESSEPLTATEKGS